MTFEPSNDDRMAVMHRLLEPTYAERLHPRVEAAYRGDEDRAQSLLYGSRSGSVTPLGPDHPPTVKSDDAPVSGGRVA